MEAKPVLESDMYRSISAKLQTVPLNVRSASNVPNIFRVSLLTTFLTNIPSKILGLLQPFQNSAYDVITNKVLILLQGHSSKRSSWP